MAARQVLYGTHGNDAAATAREIAGQWHGGQASALYAFASSGTVCAGLADEIRREIAEFDPDGYNVEDALAGVRELAILAAYVGAQTEDRLAELRTERALTVTIVTGLVEGLSDQATSFTCTEADDIATLITTYQDGLGEQCAAQFLADHASGDDAGDDHYLADKVTP